MSKKMRWFSLQLKRLVPIFLYVCSLLLGQSDRGSITGTVADSSGAVIAGARVAARSTENGAAYDAATTSTGNYTLAQIPAGTYEISVSLQGFKTFVRQGVNVQVAQTVRIDIAMEVGASSESVTVNADTPC